MPGFTTSQLTPADLPHMRQLMLMFGEAFESPDTFSKAKPDDAYFRRLLAKDDFIALVTIKDDAVIGGLTAYVLEKYEQEQSEIYIYDLAVQKAYRREGVATALIKHLKTVAAVRGAWVIFVQADLGDDPAIALYTKLGTREDVIHFDIAVGKAGA
jgi:aminoglycoside 3-N-acetyltransferase I